MSGSRSSSSGRSSSGTSGRAKPARKKLSLRLRFLLRFVVFFAGSFALWLLVAPALASVSARISEPLVRLFDHHNLTQSVTAAAARVFLYYSPTPTGKPFALDYRFVSYNIPFLIALVIAVPDTRMKIRLKILALSLVMLFTIDVLMLVVGMLNYYATLDVNGQPFYSSTWKTLLSYAERLATRLNGEVPPLLIWGGLFFYYKWYAGIEQQRGRSKPAPA